MRRLKEGNFLGEAHAAFHREGLIVSQTVYHEPVYQGWHCHEHHHLSLLIKGGNREQRSNREQEVSAGSLLLYNSGERHKNNHTRHPSKNINIEIPETFLAQHGLQFSVLEKFPEQQTEMKYALLKIYRECLVADTLTDTAIQSLLLPVFTATPARKKTMPPWLQQLKMLLHDRWNETLSLPEMSLILGVHPVTISKYFRVYFNCSLGEYIREIKIGKAMQMMQTSSLSLTAIAYSCGFFDQSHFIRTFKLVTGFLPKQFQQL
ncbi:helix-turn-helix transcriptional regulator [Chitinophaga sp. RAB17]|uniref:helix-turn-helix transcriptional regulator n=1 Tax=Chitinophaga sp. RAB17 TaxID=3233049 RepID=UPI003F8E19CC